MEHQKEHETAIVEAEVVNPPTPSERILAPLELEDFSQFLYETNYGGVKSVDFTSEGIKTIGLQNGISTSNVRVEFINDDKTVALFFCTATDRNNETSDVVVKQSEKENGRINPNWIEKGCARATRNAIKARLPVQLFKTALSKAIAAGKAKHSKIIESQKRLSIAWEARDDTLMHIDKKTFFYAAQSEYGDSAEWDVTTWESVTEDLKKESDWVKDLK